MRKVLLIAYISYLIVTVSCLYPTDFGEREEYFCPTLPLDFDISSLYGKWTAHYGAATDILIIREDGRYQQIYTRYTDGYTFTSDWNKWRIETGEGNILYLHLENMRRCGVLASICELEEGGGGEGNNYWDFCAKKNVEMLKEVVLIITGRPLPYPAITSDFRLYHMEWSSEVPPDYFEFTPSNP